MARGEMRMTTEKAIEIIKYASAFNSDNSQLTKALDIAIFGLKEVQQYREIGLSPEYCKELIFERSAAKRLLGHYQAIGTLEGCREAREKQIPKTVDTSSQCEEHMHYKCPSCGVILMTKYRRAVGTGAITPYCSKCGQRLEWDRVTGLADQEN